MTLIADIGPIGDVGRGPRSLLASGVPRDYAARSTHVPVSFLTNDAMA